MAYRIFMYHFNLNRLSSLYTDLPAVCIIIGSNT